MVSVLFLISCEKEEALPSENTAENNLEQTTDKSTVSAKINPQVTQGNDHGHVWGESSRSGFRVTSTSYDDHKLYYTHNSWSADGNWIIFTSFRDMHNNNGTKTGNNIFAMNAPESSDGVVDYTIIQLTDHEGFNEGVNENHGSSTEDVVLSRTQNTLYYLLNYNNSVVIVELNFGQLIQDALNGLVGPSWQYDDIVRNYTTGSPKSVGGISLDHNENYVYVGLDFGTTTKIERVNINNGISNTIYTSYSWSVGHITANPWVSNEVIFNHAPHPDTGHTGIPPQFLHFVYGNGMSHQGIFQKQNGENPTHATWVDSNTIGFNIAPSSTNRRGYWQINKNGSGLTKITQYAVGGDNYYVHNTRVWGTNNYILDVANTGGGNPSYNTIFMYEYNASNGSLNYIGQGNNAHAHQSVSPDGQWLLYETREGGYNLNLKPKANW